MEQPQFEICIEEKMKKICGKMAVWLVLSILIILAGGCKTPADSIINIQGVARWETRILALSAWR
jgi:hypothetical protein